MCGLPADEARQKARQEARQKAHERRGGGHRQASSHARRRTRTAASCGQSKYRLMTKRLMTNKVGPQLSKGRRRLLTGRGRLVTAPTAVPHVPSCRRWRSGGVLSPRGQFRPVTEGGWAEWTARIYEVRRTTKKNGFSCGPSASFRAVHRGLSSPPAPWSLFRPFQPPALPTPGVAPGSAPRRGRRAVLPRVRSASSTELNLYLEEGPTPTIRCCIGDGLGVDFSDCLVLFYRNSTAKKNNCMRMVFLHRCVRSTPPVRAVHFGRCVRSSGSGPPGD